MNLQAAHGENNNFRGRFNDGPYFDIGGVPADEIDRSSHIRGAWSLRKVKRCAEELEAEGFDMPWLRQVRMKIAEIHSRA